MSDETLRTTIPGPKAAPPEGDLPSHYVKHNNLAGDKELTKMVWSWAQEQYRHFDGQTQRKEFCGTDGVMDISDRMIRVALRRKTSSKQDQDTISDVASTVFFENHRTLTAAIDQIFFPPDSSALPAVYEPEINTMEYTSEQGEWIAEQQNRTEQYTFDEDKRAATIKNIHHFLLEYGQQMLSLDWVREAETRFERVPRRDAQGNLIVDDNGIPTKFDNKEVTRIVKDWPHLASHGLRNCWFDAQIEDMDKQRCILLRTQLGWETLAARQAGGQFMNVKNLTSKQLYVGENDNENALENRMDNAGENATTEENGLFDVWDVRGFMPVKEFNGKRRGKGKWDDSAAPVRYWAQFAGKIGDKEAVCLQLIRMPFGHNRSGLKWINVLRDDKGAYHKTLSRMIEPLYWQDVTNVNQAFDNLNMRNNAPWHVDGAIKSRGAAGSLKFRSNMLIKTDRGVTLKRIPVEDTTGITMDMDARLESKIERAMGSDKALKGQMAFARTAATQAENNLNQQLAPIDDMADYIADQMYPWMLELDAPLWRQYGDPKMELAIRGKDGVIPIEPTRLWGPIKTKVVAVTRFKNDAARRREVNSFIQNGLPQFAPVMGEAGMAAFARDSFKLFGFDNVEEYVPIGGDYDARDRARLESYQMLFGDEQPEVNEQDNHRVHIEVHEMWANQFAAADTENDQRARIQAVQFHVQVHKDMLAQGQQQAASQQAPGGEQPTLPGVASGQEISAEMGAASGGV